MSEKKPKRKKPSKNDLRVIFYTNKTASHMWRYDPIAMRANEKTPHQLALMDHDEWNNDIMGANLVVLEMLTGQHIVDTCHNLGAKVIYEADDAVIDTYGRERKNLQHIGPNFRKDAIATIRKADAVTVTNKTLADNYARFTDAPIYVLPIYMDYRQYQEAIDYQLPERTTDEVRIGWFGSKGHREDLLMVVPALKEIMKRHPNVKFVYCGYGGMTGANKATEVTWGEDVLKDLPRSQREFVPPTPEDYWPIKHRLMDLDIGICPLIDDEFNHNKVATKWLEYSALGTPSVCSEPVYGESPYGEGHDPVVEHGRTGMIAKTTEEWIDCLERLVTDAELRKSMGQAAAKEVKDKWNIEDYWEKWIEIYSNTLKA